METPAADRPHADQPPTLRDAFFRRPTWRAWINDHNPFHLLSGLCMLAGCFLIAYATHQDREPLIKLTALLVVLNVYEALVITLGLYLWRKKGMMRDAGYLLVLEVLLIVDLAFLYQECVTHSLPVGAVLASVATPLAVIKLAVVGRVGRLGITRAGWWLIAASIVAAVWLPVAFRYCAPGGILSEWILYVGWWCVAALLAGLAGPRLWRRVRPAEDENVPLQPGMSRPFARMWARVLRRVLRVAFFAGPAASMVLHLVSGHFVFDVPLTLPFVAPLALSFAWWFFRWSRIAVSKGWAVCVLVCSSLLALAMSMPFTDGLITDVGTPSFPIWITPLRITLIGAAALMLAAFASRRGYWLPTWSVIWLTAAAAGHDLPTIWKNAHAAMPKNVLQWGVTAVVAAFALLGLGTYISLRPRNDATETQPVNEP